MKIVFLSNYYNHHQSEVSKNLYHLTGGQYRFIATEEIPRERIQLGYAQNTAKFVLQYQNERKECQRLIDEAEIVIFGSAPYALIKKRLKNGKLTVAYGERNYKRKPPAWQMPLRAVKYFWRYGRFKKLYLLCASAYAAADWAKTGTYVNKTYKWGYFPQVRQYVDIADLIAKKEKNSLLWAGRMIAYKHPEISILLAERLRKEGYTFHLNLIGNGEMESALREMIAQKGLEDCVTMLGSMKPEEVRAYMEQSEIYLFTSDKQEGWGAVLNESMNSGCAVVASHAIGSVPFLIEDGKNGLIYTDGDFDDFYIKVKKLLNEEVYKRELGKSAYKTVVNTWSAENATKRLMQWIEEIKVKGNCDIFETGPCSRAEIIKDEWYIKNGKA